MKSATELYGKPLEGYQWLPMVETSPDWRLQSHGQCRAEASRYTKMCGRPAVAALRRPTGRSSHAWWTYCERHLYGRWLEDGQLWRWAMRPIKDDDDDHA